GDAVVIERRGAFVGNGDSMAAARQRLDQPDHGAFGAAERPLLGHPAVEAYAVVGQHDLRHHASTPAAARASSCVAAAAARSTGRLSIIWPRNPGSSFIISQCCGKGTSVVTKAVRVPQGA